MEDDLRAAHRRPPDRLGVAPALVADRDPEAYAAGFEDAPPLAGDVETVLARVDLVLGLDARDAPVLVEDVGRDLPPGGSEPLGAEDRGDRQLARPVGDGAQRALVVLGTERRHLEVLSAQSRH